MKRAVVILLTVLCCVCMVGCQDIANSNQRKLNEIQDQLNEGFQEPVNTPAPLETTPPPASSTQNAQEQPQEGNGLFGLFQGEQETAPVYRYRMAFVQASNRTEWQDWYRANTNTIEAAAGENEIYLDSRDALNSVALQASAIQQLAMQSEPKFDVVVFAPLRSEARYWDEPLGEIRKTGVYSIVINRPIDSGESLYDAYVGPNFVEQGEAAATWLIDNLVGEEGEKNILVLCGNEDDTLMKTRQDSFEKAIIATPQLKVWQKVYGNDTAIGGKEELEKLLQDENNKIDIVFAHNDEMAIGAIEAINTIEGLESGKDIIVISVGASKAALDAILTGTLNASFESSADVGALVVDVADKLVDNKPVSKHNYLETRTFDINNVKNVYSDRLY